MDDQEEIIYFELNNWFAGIDYPNEEPFIMWMSFPMNLFMDDEWVKSNKLVVVQRIVDMSVNFCISAKKSWVNDNCPTLLTKHTKFLRQRNKYGDVDGNFAEFMEYCDENIGIHELEDY